ncbi:MAG: hypothetical protein ACRDS1_12400 [Pseudonocardiaceae bacterium]
MDHIPQDRQIPGEPDSGCLAGESGIGPLLCMACANGIPSDPGLRGHPVSFPVPDPPLISGDAAARALQERFLANADRGDAAANDELIAEMLRRIRALRACHEGGR